MSRDEMIKTTYLRVDEGHNTTLRDDNVAEELVQLFIVSDGELQVTRDNTLLLVIASGISSKLKNFGSEIFENGSQVHCKRGLKTRLTTQFLRYVPGAPAPTR